MPLIETNGIQMHYTEQGEGDPLLLIMGITAYATLRGLLALLRLQINDPTVIDLLLHWMRRRCVVRRYFS